MQEIINQPLELQNPTVQAKKKLKGLRDFKYLFLEQVLQLRTTWPFTLSLAVIFPLLILFGFSRIGGQLPDREGLIYIIAGTSVYSMVLEGIFMVSQQTVSLKQQGKFIYYASLPISKIAFVLALLFSRLLIIGLPGMLTPLILGTIFYHIRLEITLLWVLVLLPLTALSLSVVGMCLGLMFDSLEMVGLISTISTCLVFLASPVFIPINNLPLPLQVLGYLLPPTYAADAMRQVLAGAISGQFYLDLALLIGFALISCIGITKWLRWRL
jgi:ABC-2 type transport system permease protein